MSAMLYHLITPYAGWFFDNSSCLTGPAQVGNWIYLIEKNDTGSAQHIENFSRLGVYFEITYVEEQFKEKNTIWDGGSTAP